MDVQKVDEHHECSVIMTTKEVDGIEQIMWRWFKKHDPTNSDQNFFMDKAKKLTWIICDEDLQFWIPRTFRELCEQQKSYLHRTFEEVANQKALTMIDMEIIDDDIDVTFPEFMELDDEIFEAEDFLYNTDAEAVLNLSIQVEPVNFEEEEEWKHFLSTYVLIEVQSCEQISSGTIPLENTEKETYIPEQRVDLDISNDKSHMSSNHQNRKVFCQPCCETRCVDSDFESLEKTDTLIDTSEHLEEPSFCKSKFENVTEKISDVADSSIVLVNKVLEHSCDLPLSFSERKEKIEEHTLEGQNTKVLSMGKENATAVFESSFHCSHSNEKTLKKTQDFMRTCEKDSEDGYVYVQDVLLTIFFFMLHMSVIMQILKNRKMKEEIDKAAKQFICPTAKRKKTHNAPQRQLQEIINWYISLQRNTTPSLDYETFKPTTSHTVFPGTFQGRPVLQQMGQIPVDDPVIHRHERESHAENGLQNGMFPNLHQNDQPQNQFVQNENQHHNDLPPSYNRQEGPDAIHRNFRSNIDIGSERILTEIPPWRSLPTINSPSNPTSSHDGDLSVIHEMSSGAPSSVKSSETQSTNHSSSSFESLTSFFSSLSTASSPPEHEGLNYEWIRLKTFGTFPIDSHYSTVLAKSGWYHLGESDKTCCFSCSIVHEGWNRTDDPNNFHSPDCRFLNGHSGNIPIVRDLPAVMPPVRQTQPSPLQRESEAVATLLGPDNSSLNNEPMVTQTSSSSENILPVCPPQSLNPQDVPTPTLSVLPQLAGVQNHSSRTAAANPLSASDIAQGIQQIQLQNRTAADNTQQPQNTAVGNFSSSLPSVTMAASNAAQRHAYAASHQTNDLENSESSSDATSREAQMEALRRDPMGINFDRPKYPSYAILAKRVSSYTNWPSSLTQTPRDMALAGFFYAGYGDYCRCFFCGGGLRNWEPGDDPWVEHARWFSKCAFVRQNRGQSFIDLVLRRAAEVEEERRQNGITTTTSAANSNTNDGARSQAELKEEKLMKSAAVQSIKEMGYTEAQIKAAIAAIKRRLPTGKHKVSAQEILEVIFELIDSGELQSASDENIANQDCTQGQNRILNQSTMNSNSVSSQQTESVQENQQSFEVQRQEAPSSEVRNHSEISDSMPSFTLDELTSLRQENTSLREQIVCKICMDKNVSIAFLPCGHLACCDDCAPAMRKCPICRQFVKGTVKTYLV